MPAGLAVAGPPAASPPGTANSSRPPGAPTPPTSVAGVLPLSLSVTVGFGLSTSISGDEQHVAVTEPSDEQEVRDRRRARRSARWMRRSSSANAVPGAIGNERSLFFEPHRMRLLPRMMRGRAEREASARYREITSCSRSFGRTSQDRSSILQVCLESPGPSLRLGRRLHSAVGSRQGIVCPCTTVRPTNRKSSLRTLGARRHRPRSRGRAPRRTHD